MAFTESFTGSSGTDLADLGTGWTRADGSNGMAQINGSNQLKANTTDSSGALYYIDTGTADHYAQHVTKKLSWSSSIPFGSVVRGVDRSNYIGARVVTGSGAELYKRVSGTFTLVGSYSYTPALDDVVKLEISGTSVTCYVNGVSRVTGTVSDGVFTGVTKAGLVPRGSTGDPWLDDWECTSSGGGGGVVGPLLGNGHLVGGGILVGGRLAA